MEDKKEKAWPEGLDEKEQLREKIGSMTAFEVSSVFSRVSNLYLSEIGRPNLMLVLDLCQKRIIELHNETVNVSSGVDLSESNIDDLGSNIIALQDVQYFEKLNKAALNITYEKETSRRVSAHQIKQIRKLLGLTQQKLADQIGVTVNAVRHWEQGKQMPGKSAMAKLKKLVMAN